MSLDDDFQRSDFNTETDRFFAELSEAVSMHVEDIEEYIRTRLEQLKIVVLAAAHHGECEDQAVQDHLTEISINFALSRSYSQGERNSIEALFENMHEFLSERIEIDPEDRAHFDELDSEKSEHMAIDRLIDLLNLCALVIEKLADFDRDTFRSISPEDPKKLLLLLFEVFLRSPTETQLTHSALNLEGDIFIDLLACLRDQGHINRAQCSQALDYLNEIFTGHINFDNELDV